MINGKSFLRRLVGMAILMTVVHNGRTSLAANQQRVGPAIDVALQPGGVLRGQAVDHQGRPLQESEVLVSDGRHHWRAQTDAQGRFRLAGLAGGSYQVGQLGQAQFVRCWAPGTAPPNARHGVLLAPPGEVVRGQRGGDPRTNRPIERTKEWLANPWIFGGVVATAVAIPVAVHNADADKDPATP